MFSDWIMRLLMPSRPEVLAGRIWIILFTMAGVIYFTTHQEGYVLSRTSVWISWFLIFIIFIHHSSQQFSIRGMLIALLFFMLYILVPVQTFLYLFWSFGILALFEWTIGKLHLSTFILVLLGAPSVEKLLDFGGLELRMEMSEWISMLPIKAIQVSGNLVTFHGKSFLIDEGCAGLHLISYSLFILVFLPAYFSTKNGKRLQNAYLILWWICGVCGIILSNFIRILLLIFLASPEGTVGHEWIGVFCWLQYLVLQLLLFLWMINKKTLYLYSEKSQYISIRWHFIGGAGLLLLWLVPLFWVPLKFNEGLAKNEKYQGGIWVNSSTYQIINREQMIYYKLLKGFYDIEHHPGVCWKGDGFKMGATQVGAFEGKKAYVSEMVSAEKKYRTYWWYEVGPKRYIGMLEWRWEALKTQEEARLVNVTVME